jgi:4-hydroxy-3-polyprenylbenzoate decarboxylase
MRRIIVGITGASGAIHGVRLLEVLRSVEDIETHVVVSPAARRTLALETDVPVGYVEAISDAVYRPGDVAAAISSGSFRAAGMVVAPCSIKTVAGIATCFSHNLLLRAADVTLKERRPLVLLVRETPLHLGHLRLMVQVTEMGAVIMPPMPAFYHRPKTLEDVIDQTVSRVLDLVGVELEHDLFDRWAGPADERSAPIPTTQGQVRAPVNGPPPHTVITANGTTQLSQSNTHLTDNRRDGLGNGNSLA